MVRFYGRKINPLVLRREEKVGGRERERVSMPFAIL
jgi:hypothetical protein